MAEVKIKKGFSPYSKEIDEVQDLLNMYEEGFLPHDKGDIEVLTDKLEFLKAKELEIIEEAMNPKQFKRHLRMVRFFLWFRRVFRIKPKSTYIDE